MGKYIVLMSRRQEMSRSSFFQHYEERHATLAMKLLSFAKYRRNHVADVAGEAVDFDCLTEVYDAKVAAVGTIAQQIVEDESRFADRSLVRTAVAEEITLAGEAGGIDAIGTKRLILLLKRGSDLSAAVLTEAVRAWARQFGGDQVRRITLDITQPVRTSLHANADSFPYDAVLSVWPRDAVPAVPPPPAGMRLVSCVTALVHETPPNPV